MAKGSENPRPLDNPGCFLDTGSGEQIRNVTYRTPMATLRTKGDPPFHFIQIRPNLIKELRVFTQTTFGIG